MYERELRKFRALVRQRRYILSVHALDEMSEDDLFVEDIEQAVLSGTIVERQLDRVTKERKYVLSGSGCASQRVGVVVKLGAAGKALIITAYCEHER